MGIALQKLAEEDPTFKVHTDEETGQTIIAGMGELHLDVLVTRMLREFKVGCNVGKLQVAYRETIRNEVEAEGKFVRQSGGRGQYGHCWLRLEPQEPGSGFTLKTRLSAGDPERIHRTGSSRCRRSDADRCYCRLPDGGYQSNRI